jgi:hypothetical protein
MKRTLASTILGAALLIWPANSWAQIYYSNDFDNPVVVGPGIAASLTGGAITTTFSPYDATYGNIYRNTSNVIATELTLTSLPIHTDVDINFLLAFLDSWDSSDGGGGFSPDYLDLYIDGNPVATYTFNTALGSVQDYDGGTLLFSGVQFDTASTYYSDALVDMSGDPALSFPHSGSSLTISLIASGTGWQGGNDEAYAIDNLSVELFGVVVPEPSTFALLAISALGLGLRRI